MPKVQRRRWLVGLAISNLVPLLYLARWHQSAPAGVMNELRAEALAGPIRLAQVQQRLKAAQAALEEDDFLTALLTDFDAVVIPNTVRPPLTEL